MRIIKTANEIKRLKARKVRSSKSLINVGISADENPKEDSALIQYYMWKSIVQMLNQTKIKEFEVMRIDQDFVVLTYHGTGIKKAQIVLKDQIFDALAGRTCVDDGKTHRADAINYALSANSGLKTK